MKSINLILTLYCIKLIYCTQNCNILNNEIYIQKIGINYSEGYKNPCNSNYEHIVLGKDSLISNLSIVNREKEINNFLQNLLRKIEHVKKIMPNVNCNDNILLSLPFNNETVINSQNLTLNVLERIYTSFLYLSEHYRIMSQDWDTDFIDIHYSKKERIIYYFDRIGLYFEYGMCILLAPVKVDGAPYPNESIINQIYYPAMKQYIFRYINTELGRDIRDCIVYQYSINLLNNFIKIVKKDL